MGITGTPGHEITAVSRAPRAVGRRARLAGYLAIVFGSAGVLLGAIGAGTFLPFAAMMGESYRGLAGAMTALSVAGLGISLVGIVAGRGLVVGRPGSGRWVLAVALSLIGLVAVMGALYPVGWFLLALVLPLWGAVAGLASGPRTPNAVRGRQLASG